MKWWVVGITMLSAVPLLGQNNSISGIVIDADTRQPVPFANVFFASTTIGVSSDGDGKFRLTGFASGKYDLVVTFVGYSNFHHPFEFNNNNYNVSIELAQTPVVLNEVIVREDTTDRVRNFNIFKKYFLGETTNSKHCRIINPQEIHLFFDTKANVLVAHAKGPIQIDNNSLGYRVSYYLNLFELDFNSGRLTSFGIPSFQNMETRKKFQAKSWNKERQRAYHGSMTHFIKALGSNQLKQEGFEVKRLYRISNPERPQQRVLDAKIQSLESRSGGGKSKIVNSDSLQYYTKLRSLPLLVDSLERSELQASDIVTLDKHIKNKGMLWVTYHKEREENGYLRAVGRDKQAWQNSVIHFMSDSLQLYPNGYYEDQKNVFVEHYWAWSEKISDYLPNDYKLPGKEKIKK